MDAVIKGNNVLVGFKPYNYKDYKDNPMFGMTVLNDGIPETIAITEAVYNNVKDLAANTPIEITIRKQYKGYQVVAVKPIK